ncbi:MAG TPA: bifunctional phosphoglucose/phosphomannose isomerase [Candidatus Saccharimonadales bacterium]|nr:bifunctional phosphoglucose/phosphomannose isomerase [Candidatus Saccharimonadales bacterium]
MSPRRAVRKKGSAPAKRKKNPDPQDMLAKIEGFPAQLLAGAALAAPALARIEPQRPRAFVLLGMGGSAIAGELLRILADREGSVPVAVVRHYEPPSWISPEDFLLFSSYSGETEETLSAYSALRRLGCRSAVLASGGTLADRAAKDGLPVALLPGGYPPRAALGYSFSALAHVAHHLGVLADAGRRIESAAALLAAKAASAFSPEVVQSRNPAKQIAIRLAGHPVMLVANHRTAEPVAWRWKGQLNENSKHLAWVSVLPEMNHNEVDGLVNPKGLVGRIAAVLLRDQGDHPRITRRFEWLAGYLKKRDIHVEIVKLEGEDPMARMLGGVALGDFVSYYLALRNGADPSALPGVTALKRALAK